VAACSADARLRYVPLGAQGEGKAGTLGKTIWSGLIDAFSDLAGRVQSAFGDERNAAAEVMIGGTQQKDFLGIRSQGRRYDLPHAFLVETNAAGLITGISRTGTTRASICSSKRRRCSSPDLLFGSHPRPVA
jgi:hypothetical protein